MREIYIFFLTSLQHVTLVKSRMRNYFFPCINFPTSDTLTRSEQAEWLMLQGGETGKVTNEPGPTALNPIRDPHLIHWSNGKICELFCFSSKFLTPITVSVFQLRNRECVPWPNMHHNSCWAAGWQKPIQATWWISVFLLYGSKFLN